MWHELYPEIYDRRNMAQYRRDLGQYLRNDFKQGSVEYVPGGVMVNGTFIPIEEVDPWYLPPFVLGMTNLAKIWLRKGMEYFSKNGMEFISKRFVIYHEIEHILDPLERNESVIDYRAMAKLGLAYRPV